MDLLVVKLYRITSYNVCYTKLLRVNPVATGKTFVDFTQAAQNYTYKDHAYWPISYNFV